MPVYDYTALDKKGKTVTGIIDAEGSNVALQKLKSSGKYPISIKEVKETGVRTEKKGFSLSDKFQKKVSPAEVTMMTRQLATLINAGFPLVSAIESLMPTTKSPTFKKIIAKIKDGIVEGQSFAVALAQYPATFSPLYINMVRAGESSGTLEIVMDRLADIMEKQQALKSKITSAMAYPVLMALVGVGVLFILLTNVVPKITSMFSDMGQTLPTPTRILITVSDFAQGYWWLVLIMVAGMLLVYQSVAKSPKGRYFIDQKKLKMPLFGNLMKKIAVARFSRTLGSLLDNGVSMLKALEIVKNITGNVVLAEIIIESAKQVEKGKALGISLSATPVFPPLCIQMIQVGEQSGDLEGMLTKVADIYDDEVENAIVGLTSLLEPIMIVVMAVMVGSIMMAIFLPIFSMNEMVG